MTAGPFVLSLGALWGAAAVAAGLAVLAALSVTGHAMWRGVVRRARGRVLEAATVEVQTALVARGDIIDAAVLLQELPAPERARALVAGAARCGALAPDSGVRDRFAQLSAITRVTPWATGRARSRWWKRRLFAARVLAAVGEVAPLVALTSDSDARVRAAAVTGLADAPGGPSLVHRAAVRAALDDQSGRVRAAARGTLVGWGKVGIADTVEVVADYLDGRMTLRATVEALTVAGAGPVQEERGVQVLFHASRALEPQVRAGAVAALGAAGITPPVGSDPDEHVRLAWVRSFGRTGDRVHVPDMLQALVDGDPQVRRAAGDALLAIGDVGVAALRYPPPAVAEQAARVLDQAVGRRVSWVTS